MERHTVNLWARLLLPLGTTLPIGCDLSTSNLPDSPGVVHSQPSLDSADYSAWPLRHTSPPQIVPVDYAGPDGNVDMLPAEVATTPFGPSDAPAPVTNGPMLTAPEFDAGPRYRAPQGRWSDEMPPTKATVPANSTPFAPEAELLPPFGSSEDREVSLPNMSGGHAAAPTIAPEQTTAEFERTELPWARPMVRSAEFQAILKRAQDLNQRALELATRGAHFSAQSRFNQSLYLVASALDSQRATEVHSQALAAGLKALEEAAEFAPPGAATRRELDVAGIIAHHRTSILKEATSVTAIEARRRYYTYAQEQLAIAAGQEVVSSDALFGMGKLETAKSPAKEPVEMEAMARATVCYQAALMVDPNNFRAANELGVLMVHAGRLELARDLFTRSVAAAPHPSTLQNLAVVYHQMGDPVAAAQTRSQADHLAKNTPATPRVPVKWVDSTTFNSTASNTDGLFSPPASTAAAPSTAAPTKQSAEPKASTAKKSTWDWLPWR